MFAGQKYNEFTSSILVDGVPLVEHSSEPEPSDLMAVPTQKCYIAVRQGQDITVRFKHHKRKPETKDLMVVVKIDGKEFRRVVIGNASHRPNDVSGFYTATVDASGDQVVHSHTFRIGVPSPTNDAFTVRGDGGLGMIKLDVYRGTKVPTKHGSDLVVYEQPLWMANVKSEGTRLCVRPGGDTIANPRDAVRKIDLVAHARDRGDPWFSQVYEYRLFDELDDEGLITKDVNAGSSIPVVIPKGNRRGATAAETARLEARIATLEGTVNGFISHQQASGRPTSAVQSSNTPRTPITAGAADMPTPVPQARQMSRASGLPRPVDIAAARDRIPNGSSGYVSDQARVSPRSASPIRSIDYAWRYPHASSSASGH